MRVQPPWLLQESLLPGLRTTARSGFGARLLLSPSTGLRVHRRGRRPALWAQREQRPRRPGRWPPAMQDAAFPAACLPAGPPGWPSSVPVSVPVPAPRVWDWRWLRRLNRQMPSPQDAAAPADVPSRAGVPGWPAPVPRVRNPTRQGRRMPSPASPAGLPAPGSPGEPPARARPECPKRPECPNSPWEAPSSPWRYPRLASIADTSCGTTVKTSPTTPKSAISKIGASASLLTAMMVFAVCMPARC